MSSIYKKAKRNITYTTGQLLGFGLSFPHTIRKRRAKEGLRIVKKARTGTPLSFGEKMKLKKLKHFGVK